MRSDGNVNPAFRIAVRTRSRLSRTAESGSPTVVIEAGLGDWSATWNSWVQPEAAKTTRVCTYDRAGAGWSEPGSGPATVEQFAEELHTLLQNAGIPGPYVLVGHSLAGKNVRLFTLQHPAEVAGLVLVDTRSEYVDAHISAAEADGFPGELQAQGTQYALARRLGIARLFGATLLGIPSSLPDATRAYGRLLEEVVDGRLDPGQPVFREDLED